ncbi:MAG: peptidoglycan DD-metalloendopeptidase family protein [Chitinophagales bacterium]|jgi:septal ring factor EnvC (AmiA/AmiB activator)|nr:peptidoglycan DD-metalloendopeptidase family protein [Chitinophagales bacterium]
MVKKFLVILGFILLTQSLMAQSKKDQLQKQYQQLKEEIKALQASMADNKKQQTLTKKEVEEINSKIEKRQAIILNINEQLGVVNIEISEKSKDIQSMSKEIVKLKTEYANMIRWLQKQQSNTNKLAFVMESKNFTEAYKRLKFLKTYGNYRVRQANYIQEQIEKIFGRIEALKAIKAEKQNLLNESVVQKQELAKEKAKKDQLAAKLSTDLQDLSTNYKKKNLQAAAINKKIKNLIEAEIKKEKDRQVALAKKNKETSNTNKNDKNSNKDNATKSSEEVTIVDNSGFGNNKKNLSWPAQGTVISKFGRQAHPTDPSIFIDNPGIEIKTTQGVAVKSVYKGKVTKIFNLAGYGNCIMMMHGSYFTVYSNIENITVTQGQEIEANTTIGTVGFNEEQQAGILGFQIWQYQHKENPLSWLK